MLDLSVIIVNFNTRDFLLQCLQSVLESLEAAVNGGRLSVDARAISRGYELIVVDNASSDGSARAVRQYFPDVRLIENEFNLGFAAANNQAIEVSQGRYLLFLNPDTLVRGNAITELIRFLHRYPRAGIVTCKLLDADGTLQHGAFRFPTLWMAFFDLFPFSNRLLNSGLNGRYSPAAYGGPFEIDHPLGACMMVRRDMVNRVGLMSQEYFMYCEEIDLCIRAKRDRWRIYCQPQAEIVHFGGGSTRQLPDRMFVELFRSRLTLFRTYYNPFYQVAVKCIIALGLWWEHGRWVQRYLKGEVSRERFLSRQNACRQVFELLKSHG